MLLHMKAGYVSTVTLGKSVLIKQHWAGKSIIMKTMFPSFTISCPMTPKHYSRNLRQ